MTGLVLLVLVAAPLDGGLGSPDAGRAFSIPSLAVALGKPQAGHGETACAACHSTSSWLDVRFNHDRTGFPLTGRHQRTSCKGCHQKDFKTPLTRGCAGCHRDVHAGDLGVRCEGCHDTSDWRSRFDADAHRRTNFPLLGAHAGLPCVECHVEARERRFTRATVDCLSCHQGDAARTRGTAVDHAALGFDARECRQCHGPLRFSPALLPDHDRCFPINGGAHAGIGCQACHTSLRAASSAGTCRTGTAACTSCHEHQCTPGAPSTETDRQHANVAGYACQSQRCYGCHQPAGVQP
ncbi:MAG: cytochrome C [Myxococcaceae bacterium]|nr:cytochrome C [Myxococcaceae bacterium]